MVPKMFSKECKCIHCQEKLDQINRSKVYWDKFIYKKIVS